VTPRIVTIFNGLNAYDPESSFRKYVHIGKFLPASNEGWTMDTEENRQTMIVEGIMRKASVLIFLIRREFHRNTFSNIITKGYSKMLKDILRCSYEPTNKNYILILYYI
jgi:hypothetical protein